MSLVTVETTSTTTTTTWRRRRPPAWLLVLPLLGAALLLVVGLTSVRSSVEADLAARAAQALADDGVPVGSVTVDVSGRDARLGGTVGGVGDADAVAATVAGVEGVRAVDSSSLVLADAAAGTDDATDDDEAAAAEDESDGSAGEEPVGPTPPGSLLLTITDGTAVLTGIVGADVATEGLASAGAGAIVDEVQVQDGIGEAAGATLRLDGEIADDATRDALVAAGEDLVGPDGTVVDQLVVAAPSADDDGTEQPADEDQGTTTVDGTGDGTAADPWIAFFNTGEDIVRDFEDSVAEAREVLPDAPAGSTVSVIGYSDPRGDPEANRELSLRRAEAVADELRAVAPDLDYEVDARGDDEPQQTDALSRRVEIYLVD